MKYAQALVLTLSAALLALLALNQPQAQAPSLKGERARVRILRASWCRIRETGSPTRPTISPAPCPRTKPSARPLPKALELVLSKQDANGGWDDEEIFFGPGKGSSFSAVARQAADAVSMTALCAMALRAHAGYDPERINLAIERAITFVMNQVYRGKLRLDVYYACWRYSMGLQLLANEFPLCKDENRKAEMQDPCAAHDQLFDEASNEQRRSPPA